MKTRKILFQAILCALLVLQLGLASALADAADAGDRADVSSLIYWENKVTAPDGAAEDEFGWAVDLDGDTALVGARYADISGRAGQGAVYVLVRSGTTWSLQQKLTAADGAENDHLGWSVAVQGDTALVGAPDHDISGRASQGAVYVFVRSGTTWTQQAKLIAADGKSEDRLGCAVALDGNTALSGAYYDDVGTALHQGSAYAFTRSGTTWTQQARLNAAAGAAGDWFGWSVAVSGNTALVGAYLHDVGAHDSQGTAYVFTRSGTTWTQQAELSAADGAANDNFGRAVALDGDTALVGAPDDDASRGAAYAFTRSGTAWTQQARLTAPERELGASFGWSVALDGDIAAIGADNDDIGANDSQGSAEIWTRSGTSWARQAYLVAADGAEADHLGISVALSGGTAVVGAYWDNIGTVSNQGSVYFFDEPPFAVFLPLSLKNTP